jgi:hypothetical protein
VVELCEEAGFGLKSVETLFILGELLGKNFDSDVPVEL